MAIDRSAACRARIWIRSHESLALECHLEEGLELRNWSYCQQMLPKVSRTFALNIEVLNGELYRAILLAYLWCRIIDTVEDAPEFPHDDKQKALLNFADWLERDGSVDGARAWSEQVIELDGSEHELDLVRHCHRVADCFQDLAASTRSHIVPSVVEMARGMAEYQRRPELGKTEFLKDEADLDRYCYFVAGTVGVFLTELFIDFGRIPATAAEAMRHHAVSFGLGLQLTNITKDMMVDLSRGWCYVPQTMMRDVGVEAGQVGQIQAEELTTLLVEPMVNKAHRHLHDALTYSLAIPRHLRRMRLFCLWPLWMAMETLGLLASGDFSHRAMVSPKITRSTVRRIMIQTSWRFWSNGWLNRDFDRMAAGIQHVGRSEMVRSGV